MERVLWDAGGCYSTGKVTSSRGGKRRVGGKEEGTESQAESWLSLQLVPSFFLVMMRLCSTGRTPGVQMVSSRHIEGGIGRHQETPVHPQVSLP